MKQTVEESAKPKFGDYILVEQHRYGCDNEFYEHKVIDTFRSNVWMDVPAITHHGEKMHDTIEDVVSCICCGISEDTVIRYRISDVKIMKKGAASLPTNSMQWVRADKRLPEKDGLYFVKYYLKQFNEWVLCKSAERFFRSKWLSLSGMKKELKDIEWLDESAPTEPTPDNSHKTNTLNSKKHLTF